MVRKIHEKQNRKFPHDILSALESHKRVGHTHKFFWVSGSLPVRIGSGWVKSLTSQTREGFISFPSADFWFHSYIRKYGVITRNNFENSGIVRVVKQSGRQGGPSYTQPLLIIDLGSYQPMRMRSFQARYHTQHPHTTPTHDRISVAIGTIAKHELGITPTESIWCIWNRRWKLIEIFPFRQAWSHCCRGRSQTRSDVG